MARHSWRDLAPSGASGEPAPSGSDPGPGATAGVRQPQDVASMLQQLGAGTTTSPLAELLAERERLEEQMAALTGQTTTAPDRSRYPVASLAERRAEIEAWARARDAGAYPDWGGRHPAAGPAPAPRPDPPAPAAPTTAPRADQPRPPTRASTAGIASARPIEQGLSRDATAASARLRSQLFGPLRSGLDRYDDVTGPVREVGRTIASFSDKLNELDRKLADEGVSKSERDAVRRDLGGSTIDRVAGPLRRADEALARPRQLANALENRWQQCEQQWSGPLDRFGSYAASRDQVLDLDSGGSGDLFARADAARQSALDRRAERDREERRAEQAHERLHQRRVAEEQEAERLDRRGAREKRD